MKPLVSARLMIVDTPVKRIVNIWDPPLIYYSSFSLRNHYIKKHLCFAIYKSIKLKKFKFMQCVDLVQGVEITTGYRQKKRKI